MNEERDKFLTEAMGICFWIDHSCKKCSDYKISRRVGAVDFSTWEGFGTLWEFCIKQKWWHKFLTDTGSLYKFSNQDLPVISTIFVHPDIFAGAIYEFLKEKQNG